MAFNTFKVALDPVSESALSAGVLLLFGVGLQIGLGEPVPPVLINRRTNDKRRTSSNTEQNLRVSITNTRSRDSRRKKLSSRHDSPQMGGRGGYEYHPKSDQGS